MVAAGIPERQYHFNIGLCGIRIYKEYSVVQMDDLEEVIWNYRMNSSIEQKKRVTTLGSGKYNKFVPLEDCRPYMNTWLQCVDSKDNCCGGQKCKFFFGEWQNCHKYNNKVRQHNQGVLKEKDGVAGTFNGLSSR